MCAVIGQDVVLSIPSGRRDVGGILASWCVILYSMVVVYGVGGLDDVMFVDYVHGLAFLWVEVHKPV